MIPAGIPLFDHPVIFADEGVQVQVKRAPGTFDVRAMFVLRLLHCVCVAGEFVRFVVGKTVTV